MQMRLVRQVLKGLSDGRYVVRAPNHAECIRCGKCIGACPVDAISYRYGLDVSAEKLPLTADKK